MYSDQVLFLLQKDFDLITKGAMPIDFAFSVHTDVGLGCVEVKINNSIKPLYSKLKNGDQVEITNKSKKLFHRIDSKTFNNRERQEHA